MISVLPGVMWNLFLAAIPVALGYYVALSEPRWRNRWSSEIWIAVLLLIWLCFLPNTCYLLTEWRHFLVKLDLYNLYVRSQLDHRLTLLLMLDTAFYFCYSAVGMLFFALAIRPIASVVKKEGGSTWIWAMPLFLLVSLGVFLGLVVRFNSWDILVRPNVIFQTVRQVLVHPLLCAFLVVFAGVLWLAYFVIDMWIDGFLLRWQSITRKSVGAKRILE